MDRSFFVLALVLAAPEVFCGESTRAAVPTTPPPPPAPIDRATQTLQGLMQYFFQTERNGKPQPRPEHCPCYSCDGKNCSVQMCSWCSPSTTGCPTKTSKGCYTTAKAACLCNDPPGPLPPGANTAAEFFFSCGQLGGLAPMGRSVSTDRCLCESDWLFACTNCYRWWSAVSLEATVTYCLATSQKANKSGLCGQVTKAADSMWLHSPYNSNWEAAEFPVYIDDFSWYALAYLRVYDWTGDAAWRQRSIDLHNWAWKYGWDQRATAANSSKVCGGFFWNLNWNMKFKDTITIVEMLHVAAKLSATAETADERSSFLGSALAIWDWMYEFDDGRGLVAPNGVVSTSAVPEVCCSAVSAAMLNETNATAPGAQCANSRVPGMSYNQGLLMSSGALLYNITHDSLYLNKSLELLDAALDNLTDGNGAVVDAQRGSRISASYCQGYSDPGADFFSFKGIFAMHLGYFGQVLKETGMLTEDARGKILSILEKSSDSAWNHSAVWPPFAGDGDVCSVATANTKYSYDVDKFAAHKKNDTAPKFHWWWSTPNGSLQTPPDPRMWFTRTNIQCTYPYHNNSNATDPVLLVANVSSEAECRALCAKNSSCTKYMLTGYTAAAAVAAAKPCPCYNCEGVACYNPECVFCGTLAEKSCPHKTSKGCYTTNKAGCNCDTAPQPPDHGNCWLYRLVTVGNRSTMAACTTLSLDTGLVVVVKRPPPPSPPDMSSSCYGRCGDADEVHMRMSAAGMPSDPSNMTCQCDAACARHLDCCLDYIDACMPADKQMPTCHGHCNSAVANGNTHANVSDNIGIPIKGGGYCYCYGGCYNIYTDNNSLGSCCGDYAFECLRTARDTLCFDSRTQTSALQLFVAHHVVQNLTSTSP